MSCAVCDAPDGAQHGLACPKRPCPAWCCPECGFALADGRCWADECPHRGRAVLAAPENN